MRDKVKISKKGIVIIAVVLVLAAAIITPPVAKIVRYNIPIESDNPVLKERTIEYRGKTYYYVSMSASDYDLELDKRIYRIGIIFHTNYYTLKNDEAIEYIYVSALHSKRLYSTHRDNDKSFSNSQDAPVPPPVLDDERIPYI